MHGNFLGRHDVTNWAAEVRRFARGAASFFSYPPFLLIVYIFYLLGLVFLHRIYYSVVCPQSGSCVANPDWFSAAVLDNYAFVAIIVYPLAIAYLQLTERIDDSFRDMVVTLAGRGVLRATFTGNGEPVRRSSGSVAEHRRHSQPVRVSDALRALEQIRSSADKVGYALGAVLLAGALGLTVVVFELAAGDPADAAAEGLGSAAPPIWYFISLGILHFFLVVPCVFVMVARLGRLFRYGLAVLQHEKYGVVLQPSIDHYDHAGGLKPLGDFFVGQAYRVCVITGYLLLVTLFLVFNEPIDPRMIGTTAQAAEIHTTLLQGIGALMFCALVMQLGSVLVPFWTVHGDMVEYKREQLAHAAVMARRRQRLLALLEARHRSGVRTELAEKELQTVERWLESYETFPAVPLPINSVRKFWIMWGGSIGTAITMLLSAVAGSGGK